LSEEDAESECDSDDEVDTNIADPAPIQAFTFEIDVDIDIDSKALRDMVSVDPVVREEAQPLQRPSVAAPQARVAPDWNW
jgi:hypothetical protein